MGVLSRVADLQHLLAQGYTEKGKTFAGIVRQIPAQVLLFLIVKIEKLSAARRDDEGRRCAVERDERSCEWRSNG